MKIRGCTVFLLPWILALQSVLSLQAASDSDYSIQIELEDMQIEQSDREGVSFRLYCVGSLEEDDTPVLDPVYGIDHYPATSEELDEDAKKIVELVQGEPLMEGKTNAEGSLLFSDLERGVYLLVPSSDNPYGNICPIILQLPYYIYESNGLTGQPIDHAVIYPKADPPEPLEPQNPSDPSKPNHSQPAGSGSQAEASEVGAASSAKTGDSARIYMYAGLGIVSLFGIALIIRKKKEKRS